MSKKSFKDNPAMAFITHTTDYTHDTGMKETKSKRLNLLLTPSLHSNLLKIARVEGISLNELINIVLKKHEQQNQEAINKFTDIWGDK
jgi:hypothetical protein